MDKILFLATLVLATQISCTNPFQSDEDILISACEAEIKERSSSPSTFKLIKTIYLTQELTLEEWMKIKPDSSYLTQEAIKSGAMKPIQYGAEIRFEQANIFGAPRLHVVECSYISSSGLGDLSNETLRYVNLKIDGKTRQELLLDKVLKER